MLSHPRIILSPQLYSIPSAIMVYEATASAPVNIAVIK